jgi:endonuclease/exonuclease/phosphatase family metal-dependent hydrolase
VRIVSWNTQLHRAWDRTDAAARWALLAELQPDVVLLQEVNRYRFRQLEASDLFDWAVLSTDFAPPASDRRFGVAIAGRSTTQLVRAYRFPDDAFQIPDAEQSGFPYRTCVANIRSADGTALTLGSFHTRPAGGARKPSFTVDVARWVDAQSGPLVFGIDANTPDVDHPDFARTEFCWPTGKSRYGGEEALLGPACRGRFDVFRRYLEEHQDQLAAIVAARPNGPLAVSHVLKGGGQRRYDHLWATDQFRVLNAEYRFDETTRSAGSDHALVIADLKIVASTAHGA